MHMPLKSIFWASFYDIHMPDQLGLIQNTWIKTLFCNTFSSCKLFVLGNILSYVIRKTCMCNIFLCKLKQIFLISHNKLLHFFQLVQLALYSRLLHCMIFDQLLMNTCQKLKLLLLNLMEEKSKTLTHKRKYENLHRCLLQTMLWLQISLTPHWMQQPAFIPSPKAACLILIRKKCIFSQ